MTRHYTIERDADGLPTRLVWMGDTAPPRITTNDLTVVCHQCQHAQVVKTTTRPPRGWKRIAEALWCGDCLAATYTIRAVTVPIASPLDGTWAEFGAALKAAWVETTRAANWLVTELYARDVRREPTDAKLRPMPRIYLYPEARALFPGISPIHLTALIQQVEQTYRKRRYELLWRRAISLPTYRYPVPTPLHNQAWRLETTAGGAMVAHVRLGDRWWALRLRGGPHFYAQRTRLLQLEAGTALPAAGAFYAITATEGDHRHAERGQRVMLKLVGRFPRVAPTTATACCEVTTVASDLLVARIAGRGVIAAVHGDQIRRAICGYTVRRERLTADLAVVRRMPQREREGMRARLQRMGERQHRALRTWCQQSASQIVRAVHLAQAGTIVYADEERGFCDPFPWQQLRLAVQQATEGAGMTWVYASGQITSVPRDLQR